jgi:hypothetical protein
LLRNGFGKRIRKDPCHWKKIEKVSEIWNRDTETHLRERVGMEIEKKSKEMLKRYKDHIRIRK